MPQLSHYAHFTIKVLISLNNTVIVIICSAQHCTFNFAEESRICVQKKQTSVRADFEASRPRRLFCQLCQNPILDPKLLFGQMVLEANFGPDFGSQLPTTAFLPPQIRGQINPNFTQISHANLYTLVMTMSMMMALMRMMAIMSMHTLFQFNFSRRLSETKMGLLLWRRNA